MSNRILLLIFSFGFLSFTCFSQEKCGSYKGYLENEIKKYPDFYKNLDEKNAELERINKGFLKNIAREKNAEGKRIIPVVVHVVYDAVSNVTQNISTSSIHDALDALNKNINGQSDKFLEMYQGQFPKTPDIFAAVRGEANVEFRLARLDPMGNPTSGILRVQSDYTNGASPRDLVKTVSYWNSYQYLNIWVVNDIVSSGGGTILGYAQFPRSGSMSTDGVVIIASEMSDRESSTLTHEVGHWLDLVHIWGDAECGSDDISDTPTHKFDNNGASTSSPTPQGHPKPTPALFPYHVGTTQPSWVPQGTAGGWGCLADSLNPAGEMFMNYMDYTKDEFTTMFTKDQINVFNKTLVGDTSEYGFRIHIWSDNNVEATGTSDGFLAPTCTKEANFTDGFDNAFGSICLGAEIWLESNKSAFGGDFNSLTWDLGDNGTGTYNPNTIPAGGPNVDGSLYKFDTTGTFDVQIIISYDETTESRAYNLTDLDLTNASSYDSIISTKIVQGTMQELNDVGASNISLHIDEDGYSLESYWIRDQINTDNILTAFHIDTLDFDSLKSVEIYVDSTFLSVQDINILNLADSTWEEDVLLGTIDTFILSYAYFLDTTTFIYYTYQDSILLNQTDIMSIAHADTSWHDLDIQIDSNNVYYGEFNDTTVLTYITYIDSTFLSSTDSVTLYIDSDSTWSIDGILSTNDSIRIYYAQFNTDSILELLSINIHDTLSSTDSLILEKADSSWYNLELTISDSIITYYAQYYGDSTIELSTYVNSSLSISDSLTFDNADSTWTEVNIVGHFDTIVIYSLTFIDTTTISYLTYIDSTYLSASDSTTIFIDADNFYTIDGMLNTLDSIRIYYAQFNNDSIIEISTHIDTGLTFADSLLLLSSDVSSFTYEISGEVDTMRTYYGHYNYNRYDGYFADTLFYRGEIEEKMYIAYYTNTCIDTTIHEDFITVLPTTATNNASSYTYSFESASDLNDDWKVSVDEHEVSIWAFTSFEDNSWEHAPSVGSHGDASVRMPAKDGNILGSASLISPAYNLSAFSNPAIKFSWSGASVNNTPVNELNIYYSDDCGSERPSFDWELLGTLSYIDVANAGLYDSPFTPNETEWNDSIMFDRIGTNELKNDNIRFKFEHVTNGASNNFYLDNITIGEEASLTQTLNHAAKLTIYPNPTTGSANIVVKNMADKQVQLKVMDILGSEVKLIYEGTVISKQQTIDTDLSDLENGIYFISIYTEGKSILTEKIILFR